MKERNDYQFYMIGSGYEMRNIVKWNLLPFVGSILTQNVSRNGQQTSLTSENWKSSCYQGNDVMALFEMRGLTLEFDSDLDDFNFEEFGTGLRGKKMNKAHGATNLGFKYHSRCSTFLAVDSRIIVDQYIGKFKIIDYIWFQFVIQVFNNRLWICRKDLSKKRKHHCCVGWFSSWLFVLAVSTQEIMRHAWETLEGVSQLWQRKQNSFWFNLPEGA